ncbi:P-loop containing nucleoside triphosphate hydrolase protein [Nemania sp. FL0031]|nr:P-loop containing nucleoside triphosphate hydrolase protein [Nemania sp. FL0031]
MAIDKKALNQVVSLLLPSIQAHREHAQDGYGTRRPFVLGLSGLQGSGKSTWAGSLAKVLSDCHNLRTIVLSLDDLYLPHDNLVQLREANPNNNLYRNRGQPGTHDEVLAKQFFNDLLSGRDVALPNFDKSKFNGEGDRVPKNEWEMVRSEPPLDVLVFEGWCVGFQAVPDAELEARWSAARDTVLPSHSDIAERTSMPLTTVLATYPLGDIKLLNDNLKRYNNSFMGSRHFDFLIHLDTNRLANVYCWRIQQEEALRAAKGEGQTDEQVIAFVQVYMPAYELYLERLQTEAFVEKGDTKGAPTHVRVLLGNNREIISVTAL